MLLWALPPPVRSLLVSSCRRIPVRSIHNGVTTRFISTQINPPTAKKTTNPLRVLFCGSDNFSAHTLRSLETIRSTDASLVESIDVVHRPAKRAGRGLKTRRELPIKNIAKELKLPTHEIDTFTGWTPPSPYNIVIAVSFGLFVPPRILNAATYGGLNVHPSLLPDLYGAAPLHHTILRQRQKTGVTVQTLHPKHFDRGTILAQTPAPGRDVSADMGFPELEADLGAEGARWLEQVLRERLFVPPVEDAGWYAKSGGPIDHAEKISKEYSRVDFKTATASAIIAAHRALGDLWCELPNGERVVLNEINFAPEKAPGEPGLFFADNKLRLKARAADGEIVNILRCTVAGGKKGGGAQHVRKVLEKHDIKDGT